MGDEYVAGATTHPMGRELCAALGLDPKRVQLINLRVDITTVVITVQMIPTEEEQKRFAAVIKRYDMVPQKVGC